jgi:hypothetical protein
MDIQALETCLRMIKSNDMLYTDRKNKYSGSRVPKGNYYGLYTAVEYVVCKIDPAGFVNISEPDEYGIEIYEIIQNMKNCKTAANCRQLFYEVFTVWFVESFGNKFLEAPDALFEEFFEYYQDELNAIGRTGADS